MSSSGRRLNVSVPPHQPPLQAVGYSAGAPAYEGADPAYVVECSSSIRCPGDLPLGECPGNNLGVACLTCLDNSYDDGQDLSKAALMETSRKSSLDVSKVLHASAARVAASHYGLFS